MKKSIFQQKKGKNQTSRPSTAQKKTREILKYTICCQADDDSHFTPLEDCCPICNFGIKIRKPNQRGNIVPHSGHKQICLSCMQKIIEDQKSEFPNNIKCPLCEYNFTKAEIDQMHPAFVEEIDAQDMSNLGENIKQCRFCGNRFFFEQGRPEDVHNLPGHHLTDEQRICAAENYICCTNCHISTCNKCHAVPYHDGETCQEHEWFVDGSVCRICGKAANPDSAPGKKLALLVCDNENCQKIASEMCCEIHQCGHACVGLKDEKVHPLCPICTFGGRICQHCNKPLWGSICLILECGHTIHRDCALDILRQQSSSGMLNLPICPAPGCAQFVWHPSIDEIAKSDIVRWVDAMHEIVSIAKARIICDGIKFHPDVKSKLSAYAWAGENAPLYWALKEIKFAACDKHDKTVYFPCGWRVDNLTDPTGMCPSCKNYRYPKCAKCGSKWIQYKCARCCSVGVRLKNVDGQMMWYCNICKELPPASDAAACKGNCQFQPHPNDSAYFYGYCVQCDNIISSSKHFNF